MLVPKATDVTAPPFSNAAQSPVREQLLPRANTEKISVYFSQMRAMLHAGVGLYVALDEMGRSAPNADLRRASVEMKAQLDKGRTWSEAMRAYPGLFNRMTVSLVEAGEKSGSLVDVCAALAEFAEKEYQTRQMIKRETWYTKVLLFFSTIIVPLPLSIILFGQKFSFGMKEQLLIIGIPWLAWIIASWWWPVTSRGKPRLLMDRWKLQLPIINKVARGFAVAKTWRVMGMLYGAGVSLPTAVRLAAEACGNAAFAESLRGVPPRLERGESLSATLASTGEFPGPALGLLNTGEQAGQLDTTLPRSVRFVEMDAETALFQATKALTQFLYLLVAFKVGLQIIEFYTGMSLTIGGGSIIGFQ